MQESKLKELHDFEKTKDFSAPLALLTEKLKKAKAELKVQIDASLPSVVNLFALILI